MSNPFIKYLVSEVKRKPANAVAVAIIFVLIIAVGYMNRAALSKLTGIGAAGTPAVANSRLVQLSNAIAEREALFKRFERLQKRGASFMVIDPSSSAVVGIKVQDAVRAIAERTNFNIGNINQPRFSKMSEKIETCEVPFSGSASWGEILTFLSAVETSLPNFVWSSFSLTTKEKDDNIFFSGSLKIILVRDMEFARVIEPIHLKIRGEKKDDDDLRHSTGVQRIGEGLTRAADSSMISDSLLTEEEEQSGSEDESDIDVEAEDESDSEVAE